MRMTDNVHSAPVCRTMYQADLKRSHVNLQAVLIAWLACSVLGAGPVMAQDAEENPDLRLEEVIVTAEKREQSQQDIAISISAISGENLERFAIRSFNDVIEFSPGVSSDSPVNGVNTRNFGIRGVITQSGAYLIGENTVGFYIDNVPISLADPRLVDLERVEVLRGPQGTLYGASSLAGLMKLVTKKPDFEEVSGHVTAELNTVKDGETGNDFEASLNVPLSDTFAIRASLYREDTAGYIDRRPMDLFGTTVTGPDIKDHNSILAKGGRISAYWAPTEKFRAQLSYMANDLESKNGGLGDTFNPSLSADDPVVYGRVSVEGNNNDDLTSLELEWDFSNFQLQSTTALFDQTRETPNLDATDFFGLIVNPVQETYGNYELTRDEFTEELRLISTWDKSFNFILGAFWSDRDQGYETRFPQLPGTTFFGFPNDPEGFIFWSSSTREIEERALFGQMSYNFNEKWTATVGGRYFTFDTELYDHFRGNLLFVSGGDSELFGSSSVDDFVPKFSLEFRPNDDLMLYATASEGFRAGGSNFPLPATPACAADLLVRIGSPTAPLGYSPDGLWNYELGLKSVWADGRVIINAAVFEMDWTNIQVQVSPLCGLNGTVLNAGEARSRGVEYEMDVAVTQNLTASMGFSYIDAEFTEDVSFGGTFIFASEGSPIPDVPDWTGNIRLDYSVPIGDSWVGFIRPSYSYRGDRTLFPNVGDGESRVKDAYSIVNLRVGATYNAWTFTLFAENLTDSDPSFSGLPLPAFQAGNIQGDPTDYSLRPTTYGVSVRYDY